MTRRVGISGFKIKGGKIVRDERRLSVSDRLRRKGSKKVQPARRGQTR